VSKEILNHYGTRALFAALKANAPKRNEPNRHEIPELATIESHKPIGPMPNLVAFDWFHIVNGKSECIRHSGTVVAWERQDFYLVVSYLDDKEYNVLTRNIWIVDYRFKSNLYPRDLRLDSQTKILQKLILPPQPKERQPITADEMEQPRRQSFFDRLFSKKESK
jgi:hypothetical protein